MPKPAPVEDSSTFIAPGAIAPLSRGSQAPQVQGTSFAGTTLSHQFDELGGGSIPPDTMGAVGPNHFVIMINGSVAIYNKTGTRLSFVGLDDFFFISASIPSNGSFDPRILYDRPSGRWFACCLDFGTGVNNKIILAVSATSDPTGTWDKYSFVAGDGDDFADYQSMGVDDTGVYFGWTMFQNGTTFNGVRIGATLKANLVAASPTLGTVTGFGPFTDMYGSPQAAVNLDGSAGGRAFFIGSNPSFLQDLRYKSLTWSGSTPSLSAIGNLSTPAFAQPVNFTPSGSTMALEVGDMRAMMATIRNDRLWTCRNVRVNSSGGNSGADRAAIEWFELNVSTGTATVVQNGRVFDANAGPRHYFYGSIVPSGQGHAAMAFSGAKTSEFIGAYTCGRLSSDTANTMQAVDLIKAGVAAYTEDFGSGRNRWGDYSYTTVDPNDDMTLWTVQEYAEATVSGGSRWGTRVVKLLAPAPTMSNPSATANQGDNDKVINLTGTGFFDPGASFPNRLDVSISGDGISGKSVTWTNATTASVTFDVAAGATVGSRNITLINPDGQSVTVNGALTINASGSLPAPSNFTATPTSSTTVSLAWMDNSPDESGFKIERKLGMGSYAVVKNVAANLTSATDSALSPNSTYTYRMFAYKTGVNSPYSNEDEAITPPLPAAPSLLTATAITSTRIDLTWADNSGNEQGFRLERKITGGTYAVIANLIANRTSFSNNTNVAPNTSYTYRIRSYNANGNSPYSNEEIEVTPPLPGTPSGLTATATSSTRVNLAWTDNATDESGFKIERKLGAGAYSTIKTVAANAVSATDTTPVPNSTYTYRVYAYNANGNSAYSNEDTEATPPLPGAPTGLTGTVISSSRIDLSWTDNATDETGFKIERKTGAGAFSQIGSRAANLTTFSNTGLAANTTYTYRVRSYNGNGNSAYSNEVTKTTSAAPVRSGSKRSKK